MHRANKQKNPAKYSMIIVWTYLELHAPGREKSVDQASLEGVGFRDAHEFTDKGSKRMDGRILVRLGTRPSGTRRATPRLEKTCLATTNPNWKREHSRRSEKKPLLLQSTLCEGQKEFEERWAAENKL